MKVDLSKPLVELAHRGVSVSTCAGIVVVQSLVPALLTPAEARHVAELILVAADLCEDAEQR